MTEAQLALIAVAAAGIGVLVLLVTRLKFNAFAALLVAALLVGIGSGKPALVIVKAFQEGLGATLGGTAAVIALGAVLGRLLGESRGAEVLAERLTQTFGPQRIVWCLMTLALVVGLATWFTVGLLLILPILQTLARESKRPSGQLALPILACLSVMHGLMPPHPGPIVAIDALHARTGMVLLWGFVLGLPVCLLCGPVLARFVGRELDSPDGGAAVSPPVTAGTSAPQPARQQLPERLTRRPGFGLTLVSILLPVFLMLLATVAGLLPDTGSSWRASAEFIGHPTVALLIAVLFSMWSLGTRCGFGRGELLKFSEESIAAVAMAILVVGGGGGFARVLRDAGVADAVGSLAGSLHVPPLVYGWLVAAFIRVATGSATVAITAGSALLAPVLAANPGTNVELAVIALAFGSLFLSHLNDGGFWVVKECLGLSVRQTLRTWSVMETLVGVAGLGLTLLASVLI
ncbi:GntT/GntP/DsdX family permease [Humisphaera borealis]|uniref:Permease DsdX n=1 Tax=Humisphaera borealis TaxID=2807512 RepID=A0A7M2WW22_9BACT|nr:gluconate:H+ symporter [Humisphaera borealis]QOV89747.1 permease DsdX [Humisphaera borealis]